MTKCQKQRLLVVLRVTGVGRAAAPLERKRKKAYSFENVISYEVMGANGSCADVTSLRKIHGEGGR